jgi:CheY-like chemotaxis protein
MVGDSILVVEDSEAKLASITAVIQTVLPITTVIDARSVRSAINKISSQIFRVIVADMSLPTYDVESRERGGTPRPFGGIEVFDYLERVSSTTPVIVVSSYETLIDGATSTSLSDLSIKLQTSYPKTYAGYVFFDSAYSTWEFEFKKHLLRAIS